MTEARESHTNRFIPDQYRRLEKLAARMAERGQRPNVQRTLDRVIEIGLRELEAKYGEVATMSEKRFHWSVVEMFNESQECVVCESPEAMRRYLNEYRENGYMERDGYLLVVEDNGEYIGIEAEGFDQSRIDWTGFDETERTLSDLEAWYKEKARLEAQYPDCYIQEDNAGYNTDRQVYMLRLVVWPNREVHERDMGSYDHAIARYLVPAM